MHSGNRALPDAGLPGLTMTSSRPSGGLAWLPCDGSARLLDSGHPGREDPLPALLAGRPARASCPLSADHGAVSVARRFAAATLRDWDMHDLRGDVELVVSELVTNALSYGLAACADDVPADSHHRPDPPESIRLTLARRGANVICMVEDASGEAPILREPDGEAEAGRGLQLVAAFSRRWGWSPRTGGGKVVWALFHRPRSDS